MTVDAMEKAGGRGLHGAVYGVPSGEPFEGALVRFFEFRDVARQRAPVDAEWIVSKGRSVGSTLTAADGTFAMPFAPPRRSIWTFWRKRRTSLGFVVEGPQTSASTPVLSWSASLRENVRPAEAFLIGVDEHALIREWRTRNADAVRRVEDAEEVRRAALEPRQVKSAAERLAAFRLTSTREIRESDERVIDESSYDDEKIQELNASLIEREYAKRVDGKLSRPGVMVRTKVREEKKASRAGFAALAAENRYSAVNELLDRLRPELAARAGERTKALGIKDIGNYTPDRR